MPGRKCGLSRRYGRLGGPEVREYFATLVEETLSCDPDGVYLDVARTHVGANPIRACLISQEL